MSYFGNPTRVDRSPAGIGVLLGLNKSLFRITLVTWIGLWHAAEDNVDL